MYKIFFKKEFFIAILIISFLFKVSFSFYFGDDFLVEEWKIIVRNLINYNSLSYHKINEINLPTAYMPPLYSFFLYAFFITGSSEFFLIKAILITQGFISIISALIFFYICKIYFQKKNSIILTYIFLFYPLNFYSSTQISSITLQTFLFCLFIFLILKFKDKFNFIFFGIVSGLLMLIRGEFYLLFFISLVILLYKKNYIYKILLSSLICIIIISPYVYRNYTHFDEILITKSSGYNLWRGNNIFADINGTTYNEKIYPNLEYEKEILTKKLIKENELFKYETVLDNYYKKRAINNIKDDPKKYIELYCQKFFSYLFFNYKSNYENYYNIFSIVPEILISFLFILGFFTNLFSKKKNIDFMILISFYLLIIPIFFVLPRYKLFILPLMIFYVGYLIESEFFKRIFSKKQ